MNFEASKSHGRIISHSRISGIYKHQGYLEIHFGLGNKEVKCQIVDFKFILYFVLLFCWFYYSAPALWTTTCVGLVTRK